MDKKITDEDREKHAKLRMALEPLARGEDPDGNPLDLGKIAANVDEAVRKFVKSTKGTGSGRCRFCKRPIRKKNSIDVNFVKNLCEDMEVNKELAMNNKSCR